MSKHIITTESGSTLELHHATPPYNTWELIMEDGEDLTLAELQALNQAGFVYHSSIYDIDYEDELEDGTVYWATMDIHYFSRAEGIHDNHMPL